ncbi:hypothetical protein AZE42_09123 [Rhizopogon vesiculosus]|uniref:Uncharacterized protein n=1 Tax=Rhizopogon vesiculosus TaxID=180088 RepID=A0A1J8QH14_9AGAM|nr:hypothetical protein AZE42_09123 [Rhizopogon vesiculosus]
MSPRLFPRLLKFLQDAPLPKSQHNGNVRRRKRVSMKNSVPEMPSFTSDGRTRSILLDDANPITEGHLFDTILTVRGVHRFGGISTNRSDANFLIRLEPVRLPSSQGVREQQTLVPDDVEHPKFKPRRSTPACYVTCRKDIIPYTTRIPLPKLSPNLSVSPLCIGYQLRLRVLQELDLLTQRLAELWTIPQRLLRRLTSSEWQIVQQTNTIPCKDALALLVVPPVHIAFVS